MLELGSNWFPPVVGMHLHLHSLILHSWISSHCRSLIYGFQLRSVPLMKVWKLSYSIYDSGLDPGGWTGVKKTPISSVAHLFMWMLQGVHVCAQCGTSKTPMWRRFSNITYCNACGLRKQRSTGGR